jgi:uncharacterized protein YbcV (DUF1398 family)
MDTQTKNVFEECTRASDEERITFPEVVGKLMAIGAERYHTDIVRSEKTYYMPGGESHVVPNHATAAPPATRFSATGVAAAVRAIQGGQIRYMEFCNRISEAGCVGYIVSLAGRCAVYYGRTGESYVEPFPNPN